MKELRLTVSGARGIVGDDLTADAITRLGAAFASLGGDKPVLVGGDTRISGPAVRHALLGGLTMAGTTVLDCGICPTPSMLLAARSHDVSGALIITASHNPIEWNALKFVGADGFFLSPEKGEELARRFRENEFSWATYDRLGRVEPGPDTISDYLAAILENRFLDVESIRAKRYQVVLDGAGGAGAASALKLLDALGCEVTALHCKPDGFFPRPPEPKPENLGALGDAVAESGAAVGFALDPDGDRLSLVADGGEPLVEEMTVAIATDYVLRKEPGPVVINLSSSRRSEDLAERRGVPFYRTPVGEAHVAAKMVEVGAVIGGEGNGGTMLPSLHPMRDAGIGIALTLQAMVEHGAPLSSLAEALPHYVILKTVVSADTFDRERLLAALGDRFGESTVDERDGLRIAWRNSWAHVRPSNTEPVVRIVVEAPDLETATEIQSAAGEAVGG